MTACSRKSPYFILVIFYVLVMTVGLSRLNPDLRLDTVNEPDIEMNQIPQDPLDSSSEKNVWEDQDLVNKYELLTFVTEVSANNSLILLFYKKIFHPVFSPPPETFPV